MITTIGTGIWRCRYPRALARERCLWPTAVRCVTAAGQRSRRRMTPLLQSHRSDYGEDQRQDDGEKRVCPARSCGGVRRGRRRRMYSLRSELQAPRHQARDRKAQDHRCTEYLQHPVRCLEVMEQVCAGLQHDDAGAEIDRRDLQHPAVPQFGQEPPEAHDPCASVLRNSAPEPRLVPCSGRLRRSRARVASALSVRRRYLSQRSRPVTKSAGALFV